MNIFTIENYNYIYDILFLVCLFTFVKHKCYKGSKKRHIVCGIYALCFTVMQLFGYWVIRCGGDNLTLDAQEVHQTYAYVTLFLKVLELAAIVYVSLLILLYWVQHHPGKWQKPTAASPKTFWYRLGVILLLWLPYFLMLGPVLSTDSLSQIAQGYGTVELSNHHPLFHTLIMSGIVRLGAVIFGSVKAGVTFFAFLQMLAMALLVTYQVGYLKQRGCSKRLTRFAFCFYALVPFVPLSAITLTKDVWLTGFISIFLMMMYDMLRNPTYFYGNRKSQSLFGLVILLVFFSKTVGIVMVVLPVMVVCILHKDKKLKRVLAKTVALTLAFWLLINELLLPLFGVKRTEMREMLCIPIQQMTRTIVYESDSFTDRDAECFSFIPQSLALQCYDAFNVDGVKGNMDDAYLQEHFGEFANNWIHLGIRYPKRYWEAFLYATCGYWDLQYPGMEMCQMSYEYAVLHYGEYFHWEEVDSHIDTDMALGSQHTIRTNLFTVLEMLMSIPFLSMLFNMSFYVWVLLTLCVVALLLKKKENGAILGFVLSVFLVCLISPIAAEFRYMYPLIFSFPVLLACLWGSIVCGKNHAKINFFNFKAKTIDKIKSE